MYVDHVFQHESLVYDILRLCASVFQIFDKILIYYGYFKIGHTKIDQHLNKFKTWKWKTKHGYFLVTPNQNFCKVFENFMLQFQNHFSPTLDLIVWLMRYHLISMPLSFWMYVDHVFQLESLVYDIRRLCAQDFPFLIFFEYLKLISNVDQTAAVRFL